MKNSIYSLSILIILALVIAGCYSSSPTTSSRYSPPDWAPAYESGVRYYYLPDIETYYDVTSGNFVYFDRGEWLYSRQLPPYYSGYDLYSGHSVILDRRVHQPWRYHQNYVSSYPRYYYRSAYGNQNSGSIRGYNENARKPVYMSPSDRARRNSTTSPASPAINNGSASETRQSDYNNRRARQPVKVTPEMREPRQSRPSPTSSPATNSPRRQSTSEKPEPAAGNNDNVRQRKSTSTAPAPPPSVRRNSEETPRPSDNNNNSKSSTEEKSSSRRR